MNLSVLIYLHYNESQNLAFCMLLLCFTSCVKWTFFMKAVRLSSALLFCVQYCLHLFTNLKIRIVKLRFSGYFGRLFSDRVQNII